MQIDILKEVPVLIICRDRVGPLRQLVDWLESAGHEWIVFVDNDSSYPPLLEYFDQTPHSIIKLGQNLGHHAVWATGVLEQIGHHGLYILTDPDVVPDAQCPYDATERFAELLLRYSDVDKVGFGLRIDDLPSRYRFRAQVRDWESQYWEVQIEPEVYVADIDTTFALYRPSVKAPTHRALRTGAPYLAQHVPWYADTANPSDEELYYRNHASPEVMNWDTDTLSEATEALVAARRRALSVRSDGVTVGTHTASGTEPPTTDRAAPVAPVSPSQEALLQRASADSLGTSEAEQLRALAAELAAIKATRSYRWLEPARRLRRSRLFVALLG